MHRGACGCACGHRGEVSVEEVDAPLLDLEKGRGHGGHTVAPTMTEDSMTKATRAALLDAHEVKIGKAASKTFKCFFRVRLNPTPDLV
ncbi:hypothetical protein HU200_016805 [Digitaria exilis]|uniref:Uncharacterized protein n=1 Tax=Digitaria exilis TaxID=1010633 RepID=A0A835KIG8_9POAL|nr:hypothetical protein HU200_016805 [Digitaria exilis]